jgi:hypothetical protein
MIAINRGQLGHAKIAGEMPKGASYYMLIMADGRMGFSGAED